jgi:hypothetical protein
MTHQIVHPEPHSKGNPGDGWKYVPRWLQIVLWIIAAQSPSVGRDLVAVPAKLHATPTPMMRFGAIREPEYAGLVLAPFHQTKVGRRKQISSGFRHGPEKRLGGILSSNSFNLQRARLIPNQPGMTLSAREKSVKN